MKNLIVSLLALISLLVVGTLQAQNDYDNTDVQNPVPNLFVGAAGLLAFPQKPTSDYVNIMGGVRVEVGSYFKKNNDLLAGLQLSIFAAGSKEDSFHGLEINSQSILFEIQPFFRFSPGGEKVLKPFFDISAGMLISETTTDSEIVHEPSFFDHFFFNKETEIETTNHKSHTSTNLSFSVGAGLNIKNTVSLGVRYHRSNTIKYVDPNSIYVEADQLQYNVKKVPIDMIVLTIGLSLSKLPIQ